MKPIHINNFLENESFNYLKNYIENLSNSFTRDDYNPKHSKYAKQVVLTKDLLEKIQQSIFKNIQVKNNIIATEMVKFQIVDGNIPNLKSSKHELPYTISLTLTITKHVKDWALCIDEYIFDDDENSAIFFDSKNSYKHRTKYSSASEDDYILLLNIYAVEENSWVNFLPDKIKDLIQTVYIN